MTDLDPRLIRMLARHFHSVQGLRQVAVGVLLQSLAQVWLATHSELWTTVGGVLAFGVYLGLLAACDRYYARFGRVVSAVPRRWVTPLFAVAISFLMPRRFLGGPNVVWTCLSILPLWEAWDCRPYRWHHLLTAIAILYTAFGRAAYPDAGDNAWMAPRMWAVSGALLITGVLDHRLFVRAMRQRRAVAADGSQESTYADTV